MSEISSLNEKILDAYCNKDFEVCLKMITESLQVDPSNVQHKILQASCWTLMNTNQEEAQKSLKEIINNDPTNSFACYGLGYSLYCSGELLDCQEYLEKAYELNPSSTMQKAVELKQKALSIMAAIVDANSNFEEGDANKALKILSAAQLIDPENPRVQENIKNVREYFLKEMLDCLDDGGQKEVDESTTKFEFTYKSNQVEALIITGNLAKAEMLINDMTKLNPESNHLEYLNGMFHYMKGSLKVAIAALEEVIKTDPLHHEAMTMLVKATKLDKFMNDSANLTKMNDHNAVIQLLTKALTIDSSNTIINRTMYFQRAMAHFSLDNPHAAYADYKMFEESGIRIEDILKIVKS